MELKCTLMVFGFFLLSSESYGCGVGFKTMYRFCVDEDECVTPSPCGENAQCFNTDGSYYCTCDEGFQSYPANFTATTGQCEDIDECKEDPDVCGTKAACTNLLGSFICVCHSGYSNYGNDQSECTESSQMRFCVESG
ncbi:hypothetical protein R3I93_005629 [Phoxinus phoxinus]|uniref:EGF-like domain-containing protein n=1 Tax=Phoxinus phoxinus TaxID=58324 RepID=A0AAN9HB86_9TELE